MNYIDQLLKHDVFNRELEDIEVVITLIEGVTYPASFLEDETDTTLTINKTVDDGTERLMILNKDLIESVEISYRESKKDGKTDKEFMRSYR